MRDRERERYVGSERERYVSVGDDALLHRAARRRPYCCRRRCSRGRNRRREGVVDDNATAVGVVIVVAVSQASYFACPLPSCSPLRCARCTSSSSPSMRYCSQPSWSLPSPSTPWCCAVLLRCSAVRRTLCTSSSSSSSSTSCSLAPPSSLKAFGRAVVALAEPLLRRVLVVEDVEDVGAVLYARRFRRRRCGLHDRCCCRRR